jgi:hypothetical protein
MLQDNDAVAHFHFPEVVLQDVSLKNSVGENSRS